MTTYSFPGMNPDGSSSRRGAARADATTHVLLSTWQLRRDGPPRLLSQAWRKERFRNGELVEVEVGRKDGQ